MDGASLAGVSETTLWTLRNRAEEALRPDGILDDPHAIRLYESIDDDYDRFGPPSQSHPLRALAFDDVTRDYLREHPRATVVALGEGLQTSYWRLGRPQVPWLSVDLPEVIAVRERLLPAEDRVRHLGQSALDRTWMDEVDPQHGVIVTAEGLLMYLDPQDALGLIAELARRFAGGAFVYDSIPRWFSAKTQKGLATSDRYTAPPMPFSQTVSEARTLPGRVRGIAGVEDVRLPPGRGLWGIRPLRLLTGAPVLRDLRPSITALRFAR